MLSSYPVKTRMFTLGFRFLMLKIAWLEATIKQPHKQVQGLESNNEKTKEWGRNET
jgi:hypothetical protein